MQPDMSLDNIKMASSDLLEKTDLDSGGFGKVSLCYHRSHGFVILKKVYTGPNRAEYNEVLLEEGKMMHRLRHSRVVKLLGIIIEEGNYSLVMEYMEKGNLMHVLKTQIDVPLSLKGRIIVEAIEGMCYLHDKGVIHKDLKPENILVDRDFHIKVQTANSKQVAATISPSGWLWDARKNSHRPLDAIGQMKDSRSWCGFL